MRSVLVCLLVLAACSRAYSTDGPGDGTGSTDAARVEPDDARTGGAGFVDAAVPVDAPVVADAAGLDAAPAIPDAAPDASAGIITGGPCASGVAGATAYRIRWADGGGTAYVVYEVNGLPDTSRDHAGAYGYQIGFTPQFVDPFLGEGGLLLDSSDFVDIEISTAGITSIASATLAIYGRSYSTTTSGSFSWQTFTGAGAAPTNLVSNAAPYIWYTADMTAALAPGDAGVLLRIEAGPSSGSLVVHRIEICMQAS